MSRGENWLSLRAGGVTRSRILSMRSPPKTPTRKPSGAGRAAAKSGSRSFVPDVGDLIWLDFDPKAGHEQEVRRPAVVLSRAGYNAESGNSGVCPGT